MTEEERAAAYRVQFVARVAARTSMLTVGLAAPPARLMAAHAAWEPVRAFQQEIQAGAFSPAPPVRVAGIRKRPRGLRGVEYPNGGGLR